MVGWHRGAALDARGRPRVIDYKTTADIWWRKEHDNVEFGRDCELEKLSYYPIPEVPEPPLDYDPLAQFPGLSVDESFQVLHSRHVPRRRVRVHCHHSATEQMILYTVTWPSQLQCQTTCCNYTQLIALHRVMLPAARCLWVSAAAWGPQPRRSCGCGAGLRSREGQACHPAGGHLNYRRCWRDRVNHTVIILCAIILQGCALISVELDGAPISLSSVLPASALLTGSTMVPYSALVFVARPCSLPITSAQTRWRATRCFSAACSACAARASGEHHNHAHQHHRSNERARAQLLVAN